MNLGDLKLRITLIYQSMVYLGSVKIYFPTLAACIGDCQYRHMMLCGVFL